MATNQRERWDRIKEPTATAQPAKVRTEVPGSGGERWCIIRAVDSATQTMTAQLIHYDDDLQRWRAQGPTQTVQPLPGGTVEMFDDTEGSGDPGAVLVPLIGELEDEDLGNDFLPCILRDTGQAPYPTVEVAFKVNAVPDVDPSRETAPGAS